VPLGVSGLETFRQVCAFCRICRLEESCCVVQDFRHIRIPRDRRLPQLASLNEIGIVVHRTVVIARGLFVGEKPGHVEPEDGRFRTVGNEPKYRLRTLLPQSIVPIIIE